MCARTGRFLYSLARLHVSNITARFYSYVRFAREAKKPSLPRANHGVRGKYLPARGNISRRPSSLFTGLDAVIHNQRISRIEGRRCAVRATSSLNEISFRASCHQERQLNVTGSSVRRTCTGARRLVGAHFDRCAQFSGADSPAQRYPRRYIYSLSPSPSFSLFFFTLDSVRFRSSSSPCFFFYIFFYPFSLRLFFITRVSAMHTGCHRRQFARKLQLKNIALWPVDRRPRWESSPGWNGSRDCSLQFVRVKNWRGLAGKGWASRWGRQVEKGVRTSLTGRRFRIKTTPPRRERTETRDISWIFALSSLSRVTFLRTTFLFSFLTPHMLLDVELNEACCYRVFRLTYVPFHLLFDFPCSSYGIVTY